MNDLGMVTLGDFLSNWEKSKPIWQTEYAWLRTNLLQMRESVLFESEARWLESTPSGCWPIQMQLNSQLLVILNPKWECGPYETSFKEYWLKDPFAYRRFDIPPHAWIRLPDYWLQDGVALTAWFSKKFGETVKMNKKHNHVWVRPIEVVGGCEANPGVEDSCGVTTFREVCSKCGRYRTRKYSFGNYPRETTSEYKPADSTSLAWIKNVALDIQDRATDN